MRQQIYGHCENRRVVGAVEDSAGLVTVRSEVAVQYVSGRESEDAVVPSELDVRAERDNEEEHQRSEGLHSKLRTARRRRWFIDLTPHAIEVMATSQLDQ
jgi:hypothetical protein